MEGVWHGGCSDEYIGPARRLRLGLLAEIALRFLIARSLRLYHRIIGIYPRFPRRSYPADSFRDGPPDRYAVGGDARGEGGIYPRKGGA